jgi:UDP-N-acetylmuramate dehydrogenase
MSMSLAASLAEVLGPERVRERAVLAPFTTFKVGGPADCLVEARGADEVLRVLQIAEHAGARVTVLGGGSNVLVADGGVRGLVIRMRGGSIEARGGGDVLADAGVTLNDLVRWTIHRGYAGLAAWAGTPGTVGGAVYGNAHWDGRLIGELVREVRLATRDGLFYDVAQADLEFGYDRSRLQRTRELVLWAVFRLEPGAVPIELIAVARRSLARRKQTQPLDRPTAGCVFQNPDPRADSLPPDVPPSAGALIERAGLKGRVIGGARVSPAHANFIENAGGASARDIRALIELCRSEVHRRFGVLLREEIVCLGDFGSG